MIKLGIVMDPIANINIKKDSSFAMLLEAQRRGYELHYMEMGDLYLINGNMTKLQDAGIFAGSGKGKDTGEEVLELEENENGESGNRTGSGGADPVHERGYRGGELV